MRTHRRSWVLPGLFLLLVVGAIVTFVALPESRIQQGLIAAATVVGAVAIWFQMKREKDVAIGDFVVNLNTSFNDSDAIARAYSKLVTGERLTDDDQHELMAYLTFFETCYLLNKRGVVDLPMLDDLFRYRFFVAMHNPDVQRAELLSDRYEYRNLFTFYDTWVHYLLQQDERGLARGDADRWRALKSGFALKSVLGDEYARLLHKDAPSRDRELLFDSETNRHSRGKRGKPPVARYPMRRSHQRDAASIHQLMTTAAADVDPAYYKVDDLPFVEQHVGDSEDGFGVVVEHQGAPVGTLWVRYPRGDDDNLARKVAQQQGYTDDLIGASAHIESVAVHPDHRGQGLHGRMLEFAEAALQRAGTPIALLTVHPENEASLQNFIDAGYVEVGRGTFYEDLERVVLAKQFVAADAAASDQ